VFRGNNIELSFYSRTLFQVVCQNAYVAATLERQSS